jgi:GT2 family glycosyltransferase
VSIVIVSWNAKDYLIKCLDSVTKTDYPFLEIIVLDNGSTDGSLQVVKKSFPNVIVIESRVNLGYSQGNNAAIQQSKGDVIVLLNQDTIVNKNWIKEIIIASQKTNVGIIGCKIYYPNSKIIQSSGCKVILSGYTVPKESLKIDNGQFDDTIEVDYVPGTAMAIKRVVIEKIGLLDSTYSAYYEDVDYCFRARNMGFKIIVTQKSTLYHFGSISFGQNSIRQCYLLERNRIKFLSKYFFGMNFFNSLVVFDFSYTIKKIMQFLTRDLAIQRENYQYSKPIPKSNLFLTLKAIINQFMGKILAYFSILFITSGS